MGRDKPKKFSKMNYQQKQIYIEKQGDKYGVNKSDFDSDGYSGGGRYETFDSEGYEKAVMRAANNDYDNRESLKYGADSGNKHFKNLSTKGISNAGELVALDRAMQKYGKKELDQTNTSSANDFGNISRSLFNESRDNFADSISTNQQLKPETEDTSKSPLQDYTDPIEFEHSPKVKAAQEQLDKYKLSIGKHNLFGSVDQEPPASNDQADAVNLFTKDFTKGVTAGSGLKENKSRNINNAIDAVKNSYRHEFMSN